MPRSDGRRVRVDHPYGRDKVHLWHNFASAASTAMRGQRWSAGRACVDLHASCGINRITETGELRWGSALAALWLAYPFDTYVFCERNQKDAAVLAERIEDRDLFGHYVLTLDLGTETLGADIQRIKGENPETKVIVITGDSNEAAKYIRHLLPAWPGRRYVATLIDPPGASFEWEALDMLTAGERMDLMFLFPEDMDLERNARTDAILTAGVARLDRYFANPATWRATVRSPGTRDLGLALRQRYKSDMTHQLGYGHFGREFRVRNSRGGQIYTLCFASKVERGASIWDSVHKDDPSGQILLPI